jgi:hypothetical protein
MKPHLSESQVKALLIVASKSRRPSMGPYSALLDKAIDRQTTVDELAGIKEQAKGFLKDSGDGSRREVATLLYHVTVAAAYVYHDATISGRPMHKQRRLYEKYAATWAGHPIGELFHDALQRVAEVDPTE